MVPALKELTIKWEYLKINWVINKYNYSSNMGGRPVGHRERYGQIFLERTRNIFIAYV
jgi:hypothetical protein